MNVDISRFSGVCKVLELVQGTNVYGYDIQSSIPVSATAGAPSTELYMLMFPHDHTPWRLPCSPTEPRWGSCPCSMGCHVREGSSPLPLLGHSRRPAVSVGLYPHSMSATWHLLHPHVPLQLLGREKERHALVSNRTIFNSIRSLFFFFFFSNMVYDVNKKQQFMYIHHVYNQMKFCTRLKLALRIWSS